MEKVCKTIERYNMLESGDKVVVGVSGGPDSLCLLHLLYKLRDNLNIDLYVAHVNHCIRGKTANEDEKFVVNFAQNLKLPIYTTRVKVKEYAEEKRISLEEAGREVRYSFLNKIVLEVGANKIAVGHNLNDKVETFLLNLLRGSGMEGLKGIEPKRGNIIRPLIEVKRGDIEDYCKENNLVPRMDETNIEPIFARNKVRLDLIPYLEKNFNPNIIESLNKTSELIYEENLFLQNLAMEGFLSCLIESSKTGVKLSIKKFNLLHDVIKRRVIRIAIKEINEYNNPAEKIHVEQIMDLVKKAKTGSWIRIPGNIIARIEYGNLIITGELWCQKKLNYSYPVFIPGIVDIPELNAQLITKIIYPKDIESIKLSNFICLLDKDKIPENIFIRNRRNGDIINPSGMQGSKKLKDYFIDEKIPREERDRIPLIASGNEIIWIIGKRYSEKYKVTVQTKEVVMLEYMEFK